MSDPALKLARSGYFSSPPPGIRPRSRTRPAFQSTTTAGQFASTCGPDLCAVIATSNRPSIRSLTRPCPQTAQVQRTRELISSIVPRGRRSTARSSSSFLLSVLILRGRAASASLVQRNSVPSTRCGATTAGRRASAAITSRGAGDLHRQALSHDHLFERSMLCTASSSMTRIVSSPQRDMPKLPSHSHPFACGRSDVASSRSCPAGRAEVPFFNGSTDADGRRAIWKSADN